MRRAVLLAALLAGVALTGSSPAGRSGCFPGCYPVGDFDPGWSSDGSAIGFSRGVGSAVPSMFGRIEAAGSAVQTTPSGTNALSSPDLSRIAYLRNATDLVISRFGSREGTLIAHFAPPTHGQLLDWSRDGHLIALENDREGLLVVRADGSGVQTLVPHASPLVARWSPDGTTLAYVDDGQLVVAGTDGSPPAALVGDVDGASPPTWSPDGRRLAFVRPLLPAPGPIRGAQLGVVNVSTGVSAGVADGAAGPTGFGPRQQLTWAPDSSRLVYTAVPPNRGFLAWDTDYELRSVNLDGTRNVVVAHGRNPMLSPDGSRLAYAAFGPCDQSGITVSGPAGQQPRRLTWTCTLRGTDRADVIDATDNSEEIVALGGNDRVAGKAGHDWLHGGSGDDTLDGGVGNDSIWAGSGHDRIRGGPGRDAVYAADGQRDAVSCGTNVQRASWERDEVFADRLDRVDADCEVVYGSSSRAQASIRLRITVWPEGREAGGPRVHTLRCDPPGGTLRRPAAACRRLAALEQPFAPVPADVACTQIFAGPQEALVTGTVDGRKVWARFNRRNGCQADRWKRHAFLFAA
jgi:Tol biopolymer transport system component